MKKEMIKSTEEAIALLKTMKIAALTNPKANPWVDPDSIDRSIKKMEDRLELIKNSKIFK